MSDLSFESSAHVVGGHATTLRTASELVDAYATILGRYGRKITGIDADVAAALAAIEDQQ